MGKRPARLRQALGYGCYRTGELLWIHLDRRHADRQAGYYNNLCSGDDPLCFVRRVKITPTGKGGAK